MVDSIGKAIPPALHYTQCAPANERPFTLEQK